MTIHSIHSIHKREKAPKKSAKTKEKPTCTIVRPTLGIHRVCTMDDSCFQSDKPLLRPDW